MKAKSILLAAAIAMSLSTTAQTDVTSTYLTNADFSSGWSTTAIGSGTVASVDGWSGVSTGDSWYYGGAVSYAGGIQVNGVACSQNPDGGTDGGALGLSAGWGCTVQYRQSVTLPAGVYMIQYSAYNANPDATQATNLIGFVDEAGVTHYGSVTSFPSSQWTTETITMTLTEATQGYFSVGMGAVSDGSGANAKLFVDHITVSRYDDAADLTSLVNTSGWGGTGTYTANGVTGSEVFQWAASLATGTRMSQTVALPNGKYSVEMYAMSSSTSSRDNTSNVISPDGATGYVSLHVGSLSQQLPTYNRTAFSAFDTYTFPCVDVTDGSLTMSLVEDQSGPNWLVMQIKSLRYLGPARTGDINMNDRVNISDVTQLVNIILGKSVDTYGMGNVNAQDGIEEADVTELVDIILGKSTGPATSSEVIVRGTLYAQQNSGDAYTTTSVLDDQTAAYATYDLSQKFTQLNITTSLSNVTSVSVYAKDKTPIAGNFVYRSRTGGCTSSGTALTYGSSTLSDVVTITEGTSGTYTATLLPVTLASGVTVTVRCSDGSYYSQDFNVTPGITNTLAFTATTASNNWMATIPGSTYFSMLSTPSAHDAATSGCTDYTYLSKCQSVDIPTLLKQGIRAFDLRPRYTSKNESDITLDNLTIYHGQVSTGVLFKDAIDYIIAFVRENPSEAVSVIMSKEDATPLLSSYTDYSETWRASLRECFSDASRSPYLMGSVRGYQTLDDVRGKVSIVSRNPYGNSSNNYRDVIYGAVIESWPDASSVTDYSCSMTQAWNWVDCHASVEDAYNDSNSDKQTHAQALLDLASANTDSYHYHYTYLSIAGSLTSNLTGHAKVMNNWGANYITNTLTGPAGYVYADCLSDTSYNGPALVKSVINQNYKYVFQGRTK